MNAASTALPADMWDTNGHMGGGWWIVMMIWMVLFWGAVIVGVVWLARGGTSSWSRAERRETPLEILDRRFAEGESPERILAERLARGEIDIQEYERRLAVLQRTSEVDRTKGGVGHVG